MGHSQRLRLKDVRAAYRLIGECREMSAASAPDHAWWHHMLTELCPLVGAQVGIAGVFRNFGTPEQQIVAVEDLGWTGRAERAHFLHYQAHGGEQRDPSLGAQLSDPSPIAAETLPPRLRQVLVCLMEGDSEQQVAHRLGISAHTVHEHVKRLHRRFDVSSRGELLARGFRIAPRRH